MGKIYCRNTHFGFIPVYDSDMDEKKKLKLDEVYSLDYKPERNYQFHKKFMALCKLGCENSKKVTMPFDSYRKYATIKAGYANVYKTPKGYFVEAQSIAFDKMDEQQFQEVYNRVLDFIMIDTGADKQFIEKNLIGFL